MEPGSERGELELVSHSSQFVPVNVQPVLSGVGHQLLQVENDSLLGAGEKVALELIFLLVPILLLLLNLLLNILRHLLKAEEGCEMDPVNLRKVSIAWVLPKLEKNILL